jgi:hypothetical protein
MTKILDAGGKTLPINEQFMLEKAKAKLLESSDNLPHEFRLDAAS